MLVLHALWNDDTNHLHLWVERAPRANARAGWHPGASRHRSLERIIGACLGPATAQRATHKALTLLLPAHDQQPIASPEVGMPAADVATSQWLPFRVPTLTVRNPATVLRRLAARHLPEGLTLGATTRFWLAASAFVDDLIARRCFAPYAGDADMTLLARWSPVYDAAASAHFRALAAALPGACRAILPPQVDPEHHRLPDATPLLSTFIEHVLDLRARRRMRPMLRQAAPADDRTTAARWLRRLAGPATNAFLLVRSLAEHEFGEALRAWLAPFHVLPEARGRLCVQLDSPSQEEQRGWRLSYFLQDLDEPSVLIPAQQIWRHEGHDAVIAQRRFIAAGKTLLAHLAQAAALCPPIAESMQDVEPDGALLTLEQSHAFLREHAAALEAAGIGVRVPAWWKQQRNLTIEMKMEERDAFFGVETLVKFNWQAALGDVVITRAEFESLSRLKAPLAQVRGQWVEVNADSLRRALRYFDRHKDGLTLTEAMRAASNGANADIGLDVGRVDVRGALRALMDRLRGAKRISPVSIPSAFSGELRPYQQRGLSWLAFLSEHGLGACLADDMGLGKTVQLLALLLHWRATDARPGPVLLVCPMSIVGNWQRDALLITPWLVFAERIDDDPWLWMLFRGQTQDGLLALMQKRGQQQRAAGKTSASELADALPLQRFWHMGVVPMLNDRSNVESGAESPVMRGLAGPSPGLRLGRRSLAAALRGAYRRLPAPKNKAFVL